MYTLNLFALTRALLFYIDILGTKIEGLFLDHKKQAKFNGRYLAKIMIIIARGEFYYVA